MKFPYLIISLLILFLTILYLKDRLEHFVSCSKDDIENFTGDISKLKGNILSKPVNSHEGVTKFLKKFFGSADNNFLFREFLKLMQEPYENDNEWDNEYPLFKNIMIATLLEGFSFDNKDWEGNEPKCKIYNKFLPEIGYNKTLFSNFGLDMKDMGLEVISNLQEECSRDTTPTEIQNTTGDFTFEAYTDFDSPANHSEVSNETERDNDNTDNPTAPILNDDTDNIENPTNKLVITSYQSFINHIHQKCLVYYEIMHNYTDHGDGHDNKNKNKNNKDIDIAKEHIKKIHDHVHKLPKSDIKHTTNHTHTHKDHTKHANTHKKPENATKPKCKNAIDESKYILKSKLLPYPDMTQFVRKNELKKYEIDKTKYIHKSKIPTPSRIPDASKYILKTEIKPFRSVSKWNNQNNNGSGPLDMSLDYSLYPKPFKSCHTDSSCMNSDLNWNNSQVHSHKHSNLDKKNTHKNKDKKVKNENDFNEKRLGRCSLFGQSMNNTNIFGEY